MSVMDQQNPLGGKVITDTTADATAANNVTGAASTIYYFEIDNTANVGDPVFFKVYDHASPTIGTTNPLIILRAAAGTKEYFVVPQGVGFSVALSYACVTTAGTAGTGNPANAVIIRMIAS
jgi:hypothetical protein